MNEEKPNANYNKEKEENKLLKSNVNNLSEENEPKDEKNKKTSKGNKTFKASIKKKTSYRISMAGFRSQEKDHQSRQIKEIFKSETLMSDNVKSLLKEKKINDTIVALISFFIIILCFYQLYLLIQENYYLTYRILTLRTCIVILSVPNLIFIYRRYSIDLDIRKHNLKLKETNLLTSGLIKSFLIEISFNIIQPFPYMENTFTLLNGNNYLVTCSLSHVFTILMVFRLYLIFKLLNHYNMWTNTRSKRIGNLLGFEPNSIFATKVMLTSSPIILVALISSVFIGILGIMIRLFEYFSTTSAKKEFAYMWNALWLNFVTMATVGYGDYAPKTDFGKLFCVISCLFGIFLLSMFVAVITLLTLLDNDEYSAYQKLNEKEVIFKKMKKEIGDLFDIVGTMYKYKQTPPEERKNEDFDVQRLLVKIRTHQLNERKRLLGMTEEGTEEILQVFEKHLNCDMTECLNNTIKIVQGETKMYSLATNQVEVEELIIQSKYLANRISNLANLMRILNTFGLIERIDDLEGGRLYKWKTLCEFYKKYFSNLKFNKKEQIPKGQRKSKIKISKSISNI